MTGQVRSPVLQNKNIHTHKNITYINIVYTCIEFETTEVYEMENLNMPSYSSKHIRETTWTFQDINHVSRLLLSSGGSWNDHSFCPQGAHSVNSSRS
jgi:hypothetical protein